MCQRVFKAIAKTRGPQKIANMLVVEILRSAHSGERILYGDFNFHVQYKIKKCHDKIKKMS